MNTENNKQLTGWAAILDVLSKGGTTFLVILVLAGILWLDSKERQVTSESRLSVLQQLNRIGEEELLTLEKQVVIEEQRNLLLAKFVELMEMQEKFFMTQPK